MTARIAVPTPSASFRSARAPDDPAEPFLELPAPWAPPARPGVPLLASVVPVLGALALWAVTGSILSLWLAALGPLIAMATLADGARSMRRDRRRARQAAAAARARVLGTIEDRHALERERRWERHPDVAGFLDRDSEIWRSVPDRADALVMGSGCQPSGLRVTGGGDDAESVAVRGRASVLERAPALSSPRTGVAVVGDAVVGAAVVRALALQLCLALSPGELAVIGSLSAENAWAERLPHRRRSGAPGLSLALISPEEPVPERADIAIIRVEPGARPPSRFRAVLTVHSPAHAVLDVDGNVCELAVEGVGFAQAAMIVEDLVARASRSFASPRADAPVALSALLRAAPPPAPGRLPAVIGLDAGEPCAIDLVLDGPHAIVAGVTGSGKSELLITWILGLCARHSTSEVSFLLADFKGGTAFDSLARLPHVTGVLTDLEGAGARRAIESLRAEVRWREAELARCGARDILDDRVNLPRLVIVVDEFAALLGDHPELHAVFADVAARGRALGMHLILGTQRPSGVVRESLLANCPLRISLRVGDAADSRAVIGTAEAAELAGGAESRGIALIRTAADSTPHRVRIALSQPADIDRVAEQSTGPSPRRPWLPALPEQIALDDLVRAHPASSAGSRLLLGLADEPESQRQSAAGVRIADRGLLVIGGPGSGKSTVLRAIASQAPGRVVRVPSDGEGAWDAASELVEAPPAPGTIVVVDDLDALAARLPHDYAGELVDRLEQVFRSAGDAGILVVAAAQRLTGGAVRLGDLLPKRLVLAAASRSDYIAAGGDPAHYSSADGPGRGRYEGRAVQIASTARHTEDSRPESAVWIPDRPLSGFVARRSPGARAALAAWEAGGVRLRSLEEFTAQAEWPDDDRMLVWGDPDDWQRHWRALSAVRSETDLVIDAACAPELRALTGERALPPYCEPGRGRGWLIGAGSAPARIVLPPARTLSGQRA